MKVYTPPEVAIRVYTAILTSTGTNNPTVTVLHNTMGMGITWTRATTGEYNGELEIPENLQFKTNKTYITIKPGFWGFEPIGAVISDSTIRLYNYTNGGSKVDGIAGNAMIEIRVYNNE